MHRRTVQLLHQGFTPMKIYRYSFLPDPRKFIPIETVSESELNPMPYRPPHEEVPDVETFLNRISITRSLRCAEHAGCFKDFEHLMTTGEKEMKSNGIPNNVIQHILNWQRYYRRGYVPNRADQAPKQEHWAQYGKRVQTGSRQPFPEVPTNYRPHQQGIAVRPVTDLVSVNVMPEWAVAEEKRIQDQQKEEEEILKKLGMA
eukprot:PhF_6_TR19594/c0_g1_i1/m.28583